MKTCICVYLQCDTQKLMDVTSSLFHFLCEVFVSRKQKKNGGEENGNSNGIGNAEDDDDDGVEVGSMRRRGEEKHTVGIVWHFNAFAFEYFNLAFIHSLARTHTNHVCFHISHWKFMIHTVRLSLAIHTLQALRRLLVIFVIFVFGRLFFFVLLFWQIFRLRDEKRVRFPKEKQNKTKAIFHIERTKS